MIATVLALWQSIAVADPNPWTVDVPPDWFSYSLPLVEQRVQQVRQMRGVRQYELHSYSAGGGGVLVVIYVRIVPDNPPTRGNLEDVDQAIRIGEATELPGTKELSHTSEVIDEQLVVHAEDSVPGGAFRDVRMIGVDGKGLVHILSVTCFSPNNVFELCGRVQAAARLTPPEPRALARGRTLQVVVGLSVVGLLLLYLFFRKRPATQPRRSRSRAPSSVPLEDAASLEKRVNSTRETINYATRLIELTSTGLRGTREDDRTDIAWNEIVGIVARRFPSVAPMDGTFVDLVSRPGATIRLVPRTQVTGVDLIGSPEDRARAFVTLVSIHCPDATLDQATRGFVEGTGPAAQLPDIASLAEHDRRLA